MHRPSALLIVRPRLLRDSLRHILERDTGIRVVREMSAPDQLLEALNETGSGLVVQAFGPDDRRRAQALSRQLLAVYPQAVVVSLDLARELVSLSTAARAEATRRIASIRDVISTVRLALQPALERPVEFAGARAEQFSDSPR